MGFLDKIKSKFKGKKGDDDFDDFDLDEDDFDENDEGNVPAPSAIREEEGDDDDFDGDFDDDDEFGEGKKKPLDPKKKKLIMIASAATVGLAVIGGGAYWFLAGEDEVAQETPTGNAAGVSLTLEQQAAVGLTPQAGSAGPKLSAGGGAPKLSAGGPSGAKLTAGSAAVVGAAVSGGMGGYDPKNAENPLSTAAVADVGINIPSILPTAFEGMADVEPPEPLAAATDESLFEQSEFGLIPIVSQQGQEPWRAYARPYAGTPETPVIGLVVTGLGMSKSLTEAAIKYLPPDVTLAFSPYGANISSWVELARAAGHEVLLELPMETESFPADDPGPVAMTTQKSVAENLKKLNQLMGSARGYIGFLGQHGSRLTKNKRSFNPILSELKTRGLFFMDPRSTSGSLTLELADALQMPRAISDQTLDINGGEQRIRAQLDTLATLVGSTRLTAALVPASPNSIKAISAWAPSLQGVNLAPMSSLAGRQQS